MTTIIMNRTYTTAMARFQNEQLEKPIYIYIYVCVCVYIYGIDAIAVVYVLFIIIVVIVNYTTQPKH